jgi:hypothetical protein
LTLRPREHRRRSNYQAGDPKDPESPRGKQVLAKEQS